MHIIMKYNSVDHNAYSISASMNFVADCSSTKTPPSPTPPALSSTIVTSLAI